MVSSSATPDPKSSPATCTTSCTNPACYGRAWAGRLLKCPLCARTLVLYHRATAPVEVAVSGRPPMSRLELEARASQRAHDERVHIFAVPGQPGVYRTSSKSEPGVKHHAAPVCLGGLLTIGASLAGLRNGDIRRSRAAALPNSRVAALLYASSTGKREA